MRPDMYRVVTERPRRGSRMRNRKSRLKLRNYTESMDGVLPLRQPMMMQNRLRQNGEKEFSDLLGPIRRWLHSQIGRPWDRVYSDIRRALPANAKEPVRHIWQIHIKSLIEMNCRMGDDGKVYACSLYRYNSNGLKGWEPVEGTDTFYVHPESRLLLYTPRGKQRQQRPVWGKGLRQISHDPQTGERWNSDTPALVVDSNTKAVRRGGIWHLQYYRMHNLNDIAYHRVIPGSDGKSRSIPVTYREDKSRPLKYCHSTKQANTKELRKLGLFNLPPRV